MFPIRCATVVGLQQQQMGDFHTKKRILQWKILNFGGAVKWGLKIFAPHYQKAHPYAKSGRTNRLAYVAVTLLWHYTAARKKVRENRHWKLDVVYNTAAATAPSWLPIVPLVQWYNAWVPIIAFCVRLSFQEIKFSQFLTIAVLSSKRQRSVLFLAQP